MKATVLIVDDSKLARIVVAKAIAALQPGWERVEAGNAEQAMQQMASQRIDVALLDYNMPGKNGLELAKDLRDLYPALPIAILTANVQDEILAAARAVGAAFVSKPITEEALRGFLAEADKQVRASQK
jgi:CheY-like chemotaxis protein